MTTRFVLSILSYLLLVGLLQTTFAFAADDAQATAVEAEEGAANLEPGTKCLLTAELECEIKNATADEVLIYIETTSEVEQGVPMLSKVPYTNKLFKNVGVARAKTRVVLSLPRDRIKQINPVPENTAAQQKHLQKAMEHLRAAGLEELADTVANQANTTACPPQPVGDRHEYFASSKPITGPRTESKRQGAHPVSRAGGEGSQVLVELKVCEISLTKLRECGSDVDLAELGRLLGRRSDADAQGRGEPSWAVVDCSSATVLQTIFRLREAGLLKVLAEPTLVTVSGRPATFRSGGEFPVPVPQGNGEVAVEYREFGTRVDLVAKDLGRGRLHLEVRPVISELDSSRAVTIGNTTVPALRVRTVDTAAELMAGQTLAVVGLVQDRRASVGDRETDESSRVEEIGLIVLATPSLIEVAADAASSTSMPRPVDAGGRPTLR